MATFSKIKLGDVISIKHGFAFKGEYFRDERTNKVLLTPGNFAIGGGFQTNKMKYYDGPIPEEYVLKSADLIVTMTDLSKEGDTLGFPAIVPENKDFQYLHNQRIGLIKRKSERIDLKFLFYLLRTRPYQRFIVGSASGSTVKHTSPKKIYEYEVNVPDIAKQSRIASILSSYDDLIENNTKRIKALEKMTQLLYTEWFVKFKFPGHEKVKMVDSGTEYGMIPEGWGVRRLSEAVDLNPTTKIPKKVNILHVPMEALSNSLSIVDVSKCTRKNSASGSKFKNGDILFARITPCMQNGKDGFVNFLEPNEIACGSTEFVVMRPGTLTSTYIYFLTRDFSYREAAKLTMVGASGRQRVQSAFFENYSVLVPTSDLMELFESRAENNFMQMIRLQKANHALSKMRDLLIPQLVTGKRTINN